MAWEADGEALLLKCLDGIPVGVAIALIPSLEHLSNLPGGGVEPRRCGARRALGSGVGVLAQDASDPEGAAVGLAQLLARLGRDVGDHLGDPCPQLGWRELVPAGQRAELESFGGGELARLDLLSVLSRPVLGGAVVPGAGDGAVAQLCMDGGGSGPVLGLGDQAFLAALGEEIAQARDLRLGLEADGDGSVAAAPERQP